MTTTLVVIAVGVATRDASPVLVSTVARIVAVPADIAVTTPAGETDATCGVRQLQLTIRPVRTFPLESRATAVACVD
jgi:hypothetical protein